MLALVSLTAASSWASGAAGPTLRIVSAAPVTLVGRGFGRGENVRITLVSEGTVHAKWARADRVGSFTTSFQAIRVDRCNATLAASAVGSGGRRAQLKLPQRACPIGKP